MQKAGNLRSVIHPKGNTIIISQLNGQGLAFGFNKDNPGCEDCIVRKALDTNLRLRKVALEVLALWSSYSARI